MLDKVEPRRKRTVSTLDEKKEILSSQAQEKKTNFDFRRGKSQVRSGQVRFAG